MSETIPAATAEPRTEPFTIGDVTCPAGQRATGMVPVAVAVSGETVGIPVIVLHGAYAGPVLAVDAGVHGDEYDGMEAVRQIAADVDPATLRGTLVAIPCMNVPAFEAASRVGGTDGANLNRIFPGDAEGSLTLRIAATFVERVIPVIDALVDLHTGGQYGEITPLAVVQRGHEDLAMELGMASGNPILWKGGNWGGTARASTLEAGKPAVTLEVGGGTLREQTVQAHVGSVWNILRHFGMVDGKPVLRDGYTAVHATFARASAGGFYVARVEPGERCAAGTELAVITDHYGEVRERVIAPQDGVVLWVRRLRTVRPGDETIIFGPVEEEIRR